MVTNIFRASLACLPMISNIGGMEQSVPWYLAPKLPSETCCWLYLLLYNPRDWGGALCNTWENVCTWFPSSKDQTEYLQWTSIYFQWQFKWIHEHDEQEHWESFSFLFLCFNAIQCELLLQYNKWSSNKGLRDEIKSSSKFAIFSYLKIGSQTPSPSIFSRNFSVDAGTEVASSVQIHPLTIHKAKCFNTLFSIFVAFQFVLGHFDINIFNSLHF